MTNEWCVSFFWRRVYVIETWDPFLLYKWFLVWNQTVQSLPKEKGNSRKVAFLLGKSVQNPNWLWVYLEKPFALISLWTDIHKGYSFEILGGQNGKKICRWSAKKIKYVGSGWQKEIKYARDGRQKKNIYMWGWSVIFSIPPLPRISNGIALKHWKKWILNSFFYKECEVFVYSTIGYSNFC